MSEVVLKHEGTLDKFVGDEVMALFSAHFEQADHALRAIRVGLEMQTVHRSIMDHWYAKGVRKVPIGIGIATGELIAGEMGCPMRTDYTVIGPAANLGARICAKAEGGHVYISEPTYDLVRGQVEVIPIPGLSMKGIASPITVYDVLTVRDFSGRNVG
jgi:adenylate cyclase